MLAASTDSPPPPTGDPILCGRGRTPSEGDLEEVRRFGEFLRAAVGLDEAAKARLYLEHYPEPGR